MRIKDYPEKDIRKSILKKLTPTIKSKRGKHKKGYIYNNGKWVTNVKIPNDHTRIMKHSKSFRKRVSFCQTINS